jgi:hypothetical protein
MNDLLNIGIRKEDLLLINQVTTDLSINNLIIIRPIQYGCDTDLYHLFGLSQPTKMFLRVIVGLGRFKCIDYGHQKAIFYTFNMDTEKCNLDELDEFYSIMHKFWMHKMSNDLRQQIYKRISIEPTSQLIENVEEFGLKIHYTRSKRQCRELLDKIRFNFTTTKRLRKVLDNNRKERLNNRYIWESNKQYQYKEGFEDGINHSLDEAYAQAKEDRVNNVRRPYPLYNLIDDEQTNLYNSGYKSGYKEGWTFKYNEEMNKTSKFLIGRKLIFN